MRRCISFLAICAIAGCGGGGGGGGGTTSLTPKPTPTVSASAFDTFASYETAYAAYEAEKTGQFHTAFDNGVTFPTSDSATFTGMYQSVLDASGTPTVLLGQAQMTADFAAATVTGGAQDFVGQIGGGATALYSGTVTFDNGVIGKAAGLSPGRPNDLAFDYSGTLVGNGQTVALSGRNDMGKFLQTPITGIEATGTSTATINGTPVSDDMSLYMDRN